MEKKSLYTPTQVAVSSFVGGPFASIYVLKKNFDVLGDTKGARWTLLSGAICVVAMLGLMCFASRKIPNYILPIGYTLTARYVAETYQLTKESIADSGVYAFRSNWNVLAVIVVGLLAFLLIFGGILFALVELNVISLPK